MTKAIGHFSEGISAYDAGRYTQKVQLVNARSARLDGLAEQDRVRADARAAMGEQLARQAGSGFTIGDGSALDALRESATNRELDLAVSRRNASMKSMGFEADGTLAKYKGKAGLSAGIIAGAADIMDSFAKMGGGGA